MSEGQETAPGPPAREIWIEKYRPQTLSEVVGHDDTVERLRSYVDRDDLPNLLFSGPAGVGKCVVGDTPVLTDRGLERIEDVVGETEGFGDPRADLDVLTFDRDGSFRYASPSDVFGKRTEEVETIATRDGAEMTVTPEHRLLVVDDDGFEWRRAEELESGDRIARPLEAPLPPGDDSLDWFESMDGDRTFVTVTEEFARRHEIPPEEDQLKAVVAGVDPDPDAQSKTCSLSFLRDLDVGPSEVRPHVESVEYVTRYDNRSESIVPPWSLTPSIAEFVALALAEARIDRGRIEFYNTDPELLDRFEEVARETFDVTPDRGRRDGVPYVEVRSRTLTHYLESCFDVFDGATGGDGIGSTILRADEEARTAFLRAFFDAEAHVTDHGIVELPQKDGRLLTLVAYLLSGFGIPSRRSTERKAATNGSGQQREYHTLYVSGGRNLRRFRERVGFGVERKAERLAENATRESNPNHDTIPVQNAVDDLCRDLHLNETELVESTHARDPAGRERYLEDLERVLEAATDRIETAQTVQERVERLRTDVETVAGTLATWTDRRDRLEALDDGTRIPDVERVQSELAEAIDDLGVPYSEVADGTRLRGTDVIDLLENGDHDLSSLGRFATVADRIVEVAGEMPSMDVLRRIRTIDTLVSGDLYFDEVESVERSESSRRVYDLTVPGTHNFVAGSVPTVVHNTTSAVAIAREVYGEDWRENFLELNASDDRGIDVVRGRIKDFARTSFGGYDFRIIFLDEADSLTDEAQAALRRTMEQFSDNTRFVLSCNYSSRIIDPIQSRCAVFRFSPLSDEAVGEYVRTIADEEGIPLTDGAVDALAYVADGDMRKAINALQAAAVTGEEVDEAAVYAITSSARPEEVEAMVSSALDGDFTAARATLDELLTDRGIAGGDVIDQVHRSVWEFDLDDRQAVRVLDRLGEADYRIAEGGNERVQLEALLAALAREGGA